MSRRYLFTSESVTEGHPDKICDQISDTIIDALLAEDPSSRVAAEVVVNTGLVLITGEITTKAHVNYVNLARKKIAEIGYTDADNGFSANSASVLIALDERLIFSVRVRKTTNKPFLKGQNLNLDYVP